MSAMSVPSYLLTTSQGFFFRMRVPLPLQHVLKRKELKKAIHTTDRNLATRQAIVYAAKAIELFDSLQEVQLSDIPFFNRLTMRKTSDGFQIDFDPKHRKEEIQDLIDTGVIPKNLFSGSSTTTPPELVPAQGAKPRGLLLSDAVEMYLASKREDNAHYNESQEKESRDPFRLLIEFLGDRPISEITDEDAKAFKKKLKLLPRRRTGEARKDLNFNQLIALGDKDTIGDNTIGQRIGSISSAFRWLCGKKHIDANPFFGLAKKAEMTKESTIRIKQAFSPDDLHKIFHFKLWTEKDLNQDWEYWLPLLLLHTGARVNELCQLEKKDIFEDDGIICISINDTPTKDEPEDVWGSTWKRVKNSSSRRVIPIHSTLIDLGFLRFVEKFNGRIFPSIKPTTKGGKLSAYPCKRFNEEYLVKIGVKVPFRKTFYSFRHTVMNVLKKQRVNVEERGQLAGHAIKTVTERYGDEFDVHDMKQLVERLDFRKMLDDVRPW